MDKLVIKTHNFETAKAAIKKISEDSISYTHLDQVRENKGLVEFILSGDFSTQHKVTGKELNDIKSQVETHLNKINGTQAKAFELFRKVYDALEALDKEYIQGILISIKATEETSEKIAADHEVLKNLQKGQKKTLEELIKFKQKLDSYAHLEDIDKIWNDCQRWHDEITSLLESLENARLTIGENSNEIEQIHASLECAEKQIEQLKKNLDEQILQVKSTGQYIDEIKKLIHLKDIDILWDDMKSHEVKFEDLSSQNTATLDIAQKNKEAIAELTEYKGHLTSITHLKDVDNLWDASEKHSNQIEELRNKGEESRNLIRRNKEFIDQSLAAEKEKTDTILQRLNKKIQYAYWIAGGSMLLALVELILLKVM